MLAVYDVTGSFPEHELYGLTSQARRAAFSAAVNIAEGAAKRGSREFRRFLDISIGSLAELAYAIRLAKDAIRLAKELNLLNADRWTRLDKLCSRAGFMTWRLYQAMSKAAKRA